MPAAAVADPILKRFRAALDEMYGDRIERVILFGSRARGDADDIAVFLKDLKEGAPARAGASWTASPLCAARSSPIPRLSSTPSRTQPAHTATAR
jgi:hypothetical protein